MGQQGAQRSPDGRWWWDGQRWHPVPEPAKNASMHPFTKALLVLAGVLSVLFLLGFSAGALLSTIRSAQAPPPASSSAPSPAAPPTAPPPPAPVSALDPVVAYLELVSRGARELTTAMAELAECGRDLPACRRALVNLDDAARRFQADLDQTPAPVCLAPADRELRASLALYREAARQGISGIDRRNLLQTLAAVGAAKRATDHLNLAVSEATQARC